MKQFYLQNTVSNQIHLSNIDAGCGMNQLTNRELSRYAIPQSPLWDGQGGGHSGFNIFLIQNKGKGPPGYSRSPGVGDGLFPDHPPDEDTNPVRFWIPIDIGTNRIEPSHEQALKNPSKGRSLSLSKGWSLSLSKGELNIKTEIQIFNKNQNSNFLQTLKFIIMKKQILFLALFALALIFAGTNAVFGQNIEPNYLDAAPTYCPPAQSLNCASGATGLTPIPGVTYNYSITATAGSTVHWFVTDNTAVIAAGVKTTDIDPNAGAGDYVLNAESGVYNVTTQTAVDIDISWKAFDPTLTVLLVAYAIDAAGCTDNVEVYRIQPQKAFTLVIAGLLDAGTQGATECVSPVVSATYSPGSPGSLAMDYGENWVFFAVNAANWVHSWQPAFSSSATAGTAGTIEWAYPDQANGATSIWHPASDVVEASHYAGATAIGATGQCIILRMQVDHGNVENIAPVTVTAAVNGRMYDPATTSYPATNADLTDTGAGNTCSQVDLDDTFDYTLSPRPDLNAVNPTPFVPKN